LLQPYIYLQPKEKKFIHRRLRNHSRKNITMRTHIELYEEMRSNGIVPCFETEQGEVYFEPTEKGFNVGTVANVGLLKDFEFIYDNDFSLDENLQAMSEEIQEYYSCTL